jgi:hypothetical protein
MEIPDFLYMGPLGYVGDQGEVSKRNLFDTVAGFGYWWLAQ